jgi:signal transduction histidine kinase
VWSNNYFWLLGGFLLALVGGWLWAHTKQWYQRHRYGDEMLHEEILSDYSRQIVNLVQDRRALYQLLAVDIPVSLDVTRAAILFADDQELISSEKPDLRLPIHNAAIRRVAAGGAAARVTGQLERLIKQGRTDLSWTTVWVPIMRGTDLYGMWLLGQREQGWTYSATHLHGLTTLARQAAIVLETVHYAEKEQHVAQEMQALYHQTVSAREMERGQLSRELHDGVLQDLCAISRDLKALDNVQLETLVARSDETVNVLRGICHDLRPPFLANNLPLALESLVERMDVYSSSPVSIETNTESQTLPEEITLAIYRIAQEALNNAVRHADASEIGVRLIQYPDRLRLTVTDDGQGIEHSSDFGRYVDQGHFGLAGMRERAKMIGASLDIQTARDYGTAIILEIPLNVSPS